MATPDVPQPDHPPGPPEVPLTGDPGGTERPDEPGLSRPEIPEPPTPWVKDRPDRHRGAGSLGRRKEDTPDPNGERRR